MYSRSPGAGRRNIHNAANIKDQQNNLGLKCFRCQSTGHVVKFCRQNQKTNWAEKGPKHGESPSQGRRCFICQSYEHLARNCPRRASTESTSQTRKQASVMSCCSCDHHSGETLDLEQTAIVERVSVTTACDTQGGELSVVDTTDEWAFSLFPMCDNASNSTGTGVALAKSAVDTVSVKLAELQFTAVDVNGIRCKALIDSGAQITLISDTLFNKIGAEVCGYILIQGVIGDSIRCPLSNVIIKQIGDENTVNVADGVPVVCAVAPISTNTHDIVLPPEILNEIESVPVVNVMRVVSNGKVRDLNEEMCNDENKLDDDVMNVDDVENIVSNNLIDDGNLNSLKYDVNDDVETGVSNSVTDVDNFNSMNNDANGNVELAVLQESWTGQRDVPGDLGKPI